MRTIYIYVASFLFFVSCTSVEKFIEKGDYDLALNFAVKKVRGKKNKKTKHVQGVEEAFRRLNERDLGLASRLLDQKRSSNWAELHNIYTRIDYRQNMIEPLIPLRSADGYEASFQFVKTGRLINEAAVKAAEYDYSKAIALLKRAEEGDKNAAQNAYYLLDGIFTYVGDYKDVKDLMFEAEYLGQTRVMIKVENRANVILPAAFEREVLNMGIADLNTKWTKYYLGGLEKEEIDVRAVLEINTLDVSPEREVVKIHIDEKKIKDGFDYVLDKKGNVMKDTSGNDIKVDRFKIIRAEVTEIVRTKSAVISGNVKLFDRNTGASYRSERVNVFANFEDISCRVKGDKRALKGSRKGHIKNFPQPFPSDFAMTMDAAENLKHELKRKIRGMI